MKKESFTRILKRNDPKEILEFVKRHGKKPKSVNPLIFYEDTKNGNDTK